MNEKKSQTSYMEKISWYWNLIHFLFFKIDIYAAKVITSPIRWIGNAIINTEPFKKRLEKNGSSPEEFTKQLRSQNDNPKTSNSIYIAGGVTGSLIGFTIFSLFNLLQIIIDVNYFKYIINNEMYWLVTIFALTIPPLLFNHSILYKNDKYLQYFKKFNKMSKEQRKRDYWISFIVVFSMVIFILGSFVLYIQVKPGFN